MGAGTPGGLLLDPTLPIPSAGLWEIVRLWSGPGDAFAALGAVAPPAEDLVDHWSPAAVRDRARRLAYARLIRVMDESGWPAAPAAWHQALPAESVRPWVTADHPLPATDWPATRRLGMWPPVEFVGRPRQRVPSSLLTATLRWCLEQTHLLRSSALRVEVGSAAHEPAGVLPALRLLEQPPLELLTGVPPTRAELRAVRREGWPWTSLALTSEELLRQRDIGVGALARELLAPDPEIEWRLFHLATFGEVLLGLRDAGAHVRSLRPLGIGSGPVHEVFIGDVVWDLWFEAGGLASYYHGYSAYASVATRLRRRPRPLQPDIVLVRRSDRHSRVWECKYSMDDAYLRVGILQCLAYLTEVAGALGASAAVSLTVPDPAASALEPVEAFAGVVTVEPASQVRIDVGGFIRR